MKQTRDPWLAIGVLAIGFPIAALADVSGTAALQSNTALNLDTGATVASGGDILWNGSTIAPQGKAKAFNVGNLGAASFGALDKAQLPVFAVVASSAPIAASVLVAGDVFVVFTNGGNPAKVLVTGKSGGSITLQFTTFIAAVPTSPTITAIQNNSSFIPAGFPNYGIAPSSLFVVKGSRLADAGNAAIQSTAPPGLPLALNGASITVVVNGVTMHPALYYAIPAQLAAVLPAATPVGTGTLTVTYNGAASAPAAIQVVPSALGINTYNTNTGVALDAVTYALLTYTSSGSPGEIIELWTTGLGADPDDSDTTFSPAAHIVHTPLQIYIGGVLATILYQGSSGYPGVNQINLTIPDSVPTGCWVPLAAVTGNIVSNVVTLPINTGGGACFDAQTGLSGNQILPSGGQTLRTGLVALIQSNSPGKDGTRTITTSSDAAFEKYTGIYTPTNSVSPGGCIVNNLTPVPIGNITGLDVGAITLTGPSGLSVTLASQFGIKGAFYANLPAGALTSGGTFTFKGSGGTDVGSFTSTFTLASPLLTWTNQNAAATIDRSQGLLVTWTGGNPGSYVFITGDSVTSTATSLGVIGGYTCLVPVEAGQFTVPSYILSSLPPGSGGTNVQNYITSSLSATGLDIAMAIADITFSAAATYK
jgi:uncharacterized protein (TIGR03437 family)